MRASKLIRASDWFLIRRLKPTTSLLSNSLHHMSGAANGSKIWVASAAVLATTGPRGRRGAAEGLVAVAGTSMLVNGPLKALVRRSRPTGLLAIGLTPTGRQPRTSSFPSGHAAAASAFATAVGLRLPPLALPLAMAALAVGWSRVAAARHFPSDVLAGVVVGVTCGTVVHSVGTRLQTPDRPDGRFTTAGAPDT